jgi:hypothetical protein
MVINLILVSAILRRRGSIAGYSSVITEHFSRPQVRFID